MTILINSVYERFATLALKDISIKRKKILEQKRRIQLLSEKVIDQQIIISQQRRHMQRNKIIPFPIIVGKIYSLVGKIYSLVENILKKIAQLWKGESEFLHL